MTAKNEYKITALEGLDPVRKVPGMYIGDTDDGTGFHHMLMEVLDNSVDEYLAGHCNKIVVTIHKDGSASVGDNGRGIPTYYMPEKEMSALEVVFCTLHAGGKFDKSNYKISGGLHGVGISVTNALSARLKVVVLRDGKEYSMAFEKGKKVEDLSEKPVRGKETGTFIRFGPDLTVFKKIIKFDSYIVERKLLELSYLCRGLEIEFIDERIKARKIFGGDNDISGFIEYLAPGKLLDRPIIFTDEKTDIVVDVGLQWLGDGSDVEVAKYYTNNIPNLDGGSHTAGFKTALTRTINNYINNSDLPKSLKISLSGDDIREGLISVVSIRHPDPKFSSQTKDKLVSEDARTIVENAVSSFMMSYLEQNPIIAKKIVTQCVSAYKAREAAKKAREATRKSIFKEGGGVLPGKLADCSSRNPDECELYIVEGDSAGGSAKQGRSREFQAILPLRGKVLNVEKCEFQKMMANEELTNLITAIGVGIGKNLDPESIRYKKIIIMSVDGDEPTCIEDSNGMTRVVRFKDVVGCEKTATIDKNGDCCFKNVSNLVKHKPNVPMFKIVTDYGRSVVVTGNHSVFIDNNGVPELVLASAINEGDKVYVGIPKMSENLPKRINMFEYFWERRCDKGFEKIIIKGPDVININRTKNWMYLGDFTHKEILSLSNKNVITDKFNNEDILHKWFDLDEHFFFSLGHWVAEGSSGETSVQWNIEKNNIDFVTDIKKFSDSYGIKSGFFKDNKRCDTYRILNKSFKLFFESLIGGVKSSNDKEIPQIVFSASHDNKQSYLTGYFLGNGTISKTGNISFSTSSIFMARQLLWLLGDFDVFPSISDIEPETVCIDDGAYMSFGGKSILICGGDVVKLRAIWKNHKNSKYLNDINFQQERRISKFGDRTYLVSVRKIQKLDKTPEFVYDFSVPETQRFVCGDGILCHNTDSDVDGSHIRTLLLTFFFRQMPQLIRNGNLYIAQPPLYRAEWRRNSYYLKNDHALRAFAKEKNLNLGEIKLQRFKGLGEMSPAQLWDTTMDPETRTLLKVVVEDYVEADKIFNILMGSQVEPRRDFIIERALNVRHLDT